MDSKIKLLESKIDKLAPNRLIKKPDDVEKQLAKLREALTQVKTGVNVPDRETKEKRLQLKIKNLEKIRDDLESKKETELKKRKVKITKIMKAIKDVPIEDKEKKLKDLRKSYKKVQKKLEGVKKEEIKIMKEKVKNFENAKAEDKAKIQIIQMDKNAKDKDIKVKDLKKDLKKIAQKEKQVVAQLKKEQAKKRIKAEKEVKVLEKLKDTIIKSKDVKDVAKKI